MVDVWNELGKALGRALKPLADMGTAMWTAFGDAAEDLIKGFMGGAEGLQTALEPTVTALMDTALTEASASLGEDSPPKEIREAVDKWITQLLKMIEKDTKTKGESLPTGAELALTQGKLVAGIVGMYAATHAVSIALDATQPLKDWGFKSAMMDIMYQFKMSDVIGPMIQAPIFSSVVTPLRMRANSNYPYQIPGSGVLPYLHRKGLIDAEAYSLNMKYHALDDTWQASMLENVDRYPSFSELRIMVHRGVTTWEEAKAALDKSLIRAEYLDKYEALIPGIPGSGDLVDMAVREAYQERSGDEEMPDRFVSEMAKWGFDRDACLWFWRKHWALPGVNQVYEMNRRGISMPQTIEEFLKWADFAPEWRKPLEELSWNIPGRIQARWLLRWNEIDRDELKKFLEMSGLSPEWSERVSRAVAKNQFLSDINRQIANSKNSYARGYILEETLRRDLNAFDLHPDIVEYHVVDAVADRERSIKDEQLRTLRAQYARDALSMDEVIEAVTLIILDPVARDAWIAALPTARQVVVMEETYGTEVNRLVTNAKYDYVLGSIDKPAFVARLQLLDLPDRVIEFHVIDADEDRARKHNEKRLAIIEEGYIDDLIEWNMVETMAGEILVDKVALNIYLDGVWLNKHKAVRVFAEE